MKEFGVHGEDNIDYTCNLFILRFNIKKNL